MQDSKHSSYIRIKHSVHRILYGLSWRIKHFDSLVYSSQSKTIMALVAKSKQKLRKIKEYESFDYELGQAINKRGQFGELCHTYRKGKSHLGNNFSTKDKKSTSRSNETWVNLSLLVGIFINMYFNSHIWRIFSIYSGKFSLKVIYSRNVADFGCICLIVNVGMATTKVLFGMSYFDDCPTNPYLPIYSLVGGKYKQIIKILKWFCESWIYFTQIGLRAQECLLVYCSILISLLQLSLQPVSGFFSWS